MKTRHQYCLHWKVFTTMINLIYMQLDLSNCKLLLLFNTGGGRKGHRNLWDSVESLSWIHAPWRNPLAFHVHLSFSGQIGRKILSSRRSDQSCTLLLPAEALNGGDLRDLRDVWVYHLGSAWLVLTCCHQGRWLASPIGQICLRVSFEHHIQIKKYATVAEFLWFQVTSTELQLEGLKFQTGIAKPEWGQGLAWAIEKI